MFGDTRCKLSSQTKDFIIAIATARASAFPTSGLSSLKQCEEHWARPLHAVDCREGTAGLARLSPLQWLEHAWFCNGTHACPLLWVVHYGHDLKLWAAQISIKAVQDKASQCLCSPATNKWAESTELGQNCLPCGVNLLRSIVVTLRGICGFTVIGDVTVISWPRARNITYSAM